MTFCCRKTFSVILFFAVFFVENSWAIPDFKSQDSPLPTVLKADSIDGDKVTDTITAIGNVEVNKGNSTLYSDKMVYDKKNGLIKTDSLSRVKNIEIGNLKAEKVEIKDDFSSGKFFGSKMFFADGSYLLSPEIDRKNPLITILKAPIYSICPNPEISADNEVAGKKRDFFSIKSKDTTIDRENQVMKIRGGVVRLYNMPFFYTPYLRANLPSKDRKSGFLTPSYVKSTNLGLGLKTPYYFNIAPNMDLTTTPFIGVNTQQLMINNQFRHMTSYGEYSTNFEIANNKITSTSNAIVGTRSKKEYRWHLTGDGKFDFTKDVGLDFKVNTLSDRNYMRDYYFNYLNNSVSKVNFDYINARSYHSVKAIRFQELENLSTEEAAPLVLPQIDSHIETKPFFFKEKFALTSNMTTISRNDGLQYRRLTAIPEVNVPFNLKGNLFSVNGKFQTDLYSLDNNFQYGSTRTNDYEHFQNNYKPEVSLNWKLPLIKKNKSSSLLVEPMVSLVTSSYNKNFTKLPNEDSNSSELTISNIFISDRLAGFDRNESGERVNYGVKSSFFNERGEFGLTIGQSYRRNDTTQDVTIRGFSNGSKSNIVGQAMYKAIKYFSMNYSFQLNESSYDNEINQVNAMLDLGRLTFSSDYILIKTSSQNSTKQEQIALRLGTKLTNRWKADFSVNKNLVTGRVIARGINLYRDGCCTTFGFSVVETNPANASSPQKTFNLSLSLKNL